MADERLDPGAVCTLPAEGLGERLAWIRGEILPHSVSREQGGDSITWELADAPGLVAKLDRLVALERECCSGVVFEHGPGAAAGRLRLSVSGIDPEAAVFARLDGPPARLETPPRFGWRLARAGGLGVALSLFLCCVLPIGAAALLGAAVAAPLASLDRPDVIAAVALLSAAGAFAWQGRRRAAAPAPAEGTACGPGC